MNCSSHDPTSHPSVSVVPLAAGLYGVCSTGRPAGGAAGGCSGPGSIVRPRVVDAMSSHIASPLGAFYLAKTKGESGAGVSGRFSAPRSTSLDQEKVSCLPGRMAQYSHWPSRTWESVSAVTGCPSRRRKRPWPVPCGSTGHCRRWWCACGKATRSCSTVSSGVPRRRCCRGQP